MINTVRSKFIYIYIYIYMITNIYRIAKKWGNTLVYKAKPTVDILIHWPILPSIYNAFYTFSITTFISFMSILNSYIAVNIYVL